MWRFALVLFLSVPIVGIAAPDDDLLAPLTPSKPSSAKRKTPPPTVRRAHKAPATKPVVPTLERSEVFVTLRSPIEGAHLIVDDRDLGKLPMAAHEVNVGPHLISVRRPGYVDFVQRVDLQAGQRLELIADLVPAPGQLRVRGFPTGAAVIVDGNRAGALPLDSYTLPPGRHEVRVESSGFQTWVRNFILRGGGEELLTANLEPLPEVPTAALPVGPSGATPVASAEISSDPGFFGHWYTWVGITLVVGGLAAGGYVVSTHVHPAPGASQVCAGTCDAVLSKTTRPGAFAF